ncbi:MAG: GNAT family N-acetyltransferase [Clostridia bacterium]|nr:GNAT family N-acetyltransferase [Clostridia bacterium]
MNKNIYCGRGNRIPYADYMALINLSFGFTTPETEFLGLLPKCYREEYRPQDQNYVVTEDGVLTAAVGAYDHEIVVCGRRLPCRGIGNVAVHPDHRSKGYMKLAMNKSLEDMIADGIVLSTLGGRRQRYQYFGFDKAGPAYSFSISRDNIRHTFGDFSAPFTARIVEDPTDSVLDDILRITEGKPFAPVRPRETYLDIANTWKAKLVVFHDPAEGDRFAGYCIIAGGNTMTELRTERVEDLTKLLRTVFASLNEGFSVLIPAYETEYLRILSPIAEGMSIQCSMMYNVLRYEAAIDAFLALKLTYADLPDGELTLLIHGFARDERLRITVKEGKHTIEKLSEDAPVEIELTHLQATELLFSPVSGLRETQSYLVRSWFPLPIFMYHADEV